MNRTQPAGNTDTFDVVVVGAGLAGLYAQYRLKLLGLSSRAYEAGGDIGGTWYWNCYPGARCDVDSLEYSYGFSPELEQEWEWSERYAGQAEILRYINHVADRFDLRRDIALDTRVTTAHFDEAAARWRVTTDRGDNVTAQFLILATGALSAANTPDIPGQSSFSGPTYHTAHWPHETVDFSGQRLGVIGTGSSAIQAIPILAEQAAELYVFQRTPNYSMPARNGPLDPAEQAEVKRDYRGLRAANAKMPGAAGARRPWNSASALDATPEERAHEYESRWNAGGFALLASFADTAIDAQANEYAAEFVRQKIHALVEDPAVADLLSPTSVIGCKRPCLDTNYYETYNRDNVHLVDISNDPIERITPTGLVTGGQEYALDAIVFATGFDAMTGSIFRIDLRGRANRSMRDAWRAGPVTYLGLGVPEFPNLFIVVGPGSPSVLANMIPAIEQHVDWITDCIAYLREHEHRCIEATPEAAEAWVAHVNAVADHTLYPTCNSWYLGANIPGKPRVFMPLPGFPPYVDKCNEVAANDYEGFALT